MMIRFSKVQLLKSNVCLFSREERCTAAGALGTSWEGSAHCWNSLMLLALCGSKHASMRGSCGIRADAAGVGWIVLEGGSKEVDWGGAGDMELQG